MVKKLSNEKRLAKKLKAQEFERRIKEGRAQQKDQAIRSKYHIPGNVAIPVASDTLFKEIGELCYVLNFNYYNYSACELSLISSHGEAGALIRLLDLMTKTSPSNKSGIIRGRIEKNATNNHRSLEYRRYFNELPPDIDYIYEASYSDAGRVFFFTTESMQKKNYVSVIAIAKNHVRIDKSG